MRLDLKHFHQLQKRYPGAMQMIQYEDYVDNVDRTLNSMYDHIDEEVPAPVYHSLMEYMHAGYNGAGHDQHRTNASESKTHWIKHTKMGDVRAMNKECWDVLSMLGYDVTTSNSSTGIHSVS